MMQDRALESSFVTDHNCNFADKQRHFPKFSDLEGSSQISSRYLEQSSSFSSNPDEIARYNDVWFLLSLLDGPKNSENLTDSNVPSDSGLSSLLQSARLMR